MSNDRLYEILNSFDLEKLKKMVCGFNTGVSIDGYPKNFTIGFFEFDVVLYKIDDDIFTSISRNDKIITDILGDNPNIAEYLFTYREIIIFNRMYNINKLI